MTYDPKPMIGQVWERVKDGTLVTITYTELSSGRPFIDYVVWHAVESKRAGDCYVGSLLKNYAPTTT